MENDNMSKKIKKEENDKNNINKNQNINKNKKIIPSYEQKGKTNPKKEKRKLDKYDKRKRFIIILAISIAVIIGLAVFGINLLINYNKFKPYKKYEETMKTYGFDKMYNNESTKTGESITKSEAIKMILSASFNMYDISGFAGTPKENYDNAIWVEYAKYRGIIGESDITKENADDKATYIEVIRYLANAKVKLVGKELNSAINLKVKDFDKYKTDEQTAIEDMIENEIITINTKKINGKKHIFKGQMNELISNYVVKYNTLIINDEKINISEDKEPSNKDQYPYTLASVDKSVYEKEFNVDDEENFKSPKDLYTTKKEYYSQIQEIAEGYYDSILNIDYKTINYDEMKDNILQYVLYGTEGLDDYVNYVKEHKIVIEGKSTVMFPTIYFDGLEYVVRMKLEFEIKNSDTRYNLLYMDPIGSDSSKVKYENDKYTVYIDAKMGGTFGGSTALYNDNSTIVDLLLKDQKDVMIRE